MSLLDLYRTQLRVLWEWRGGPLALTRRMILILLVSTVSFAITAWLLPNIVLDSLWAAVLAVILMALFNAIVRTVLLAFVAARSLILTGVLVLVLQVVAFLVVAQLVARRPRRRVRDRAHRLVRLRDRQHDPDLDPRASTAVGRSTGCSSSACSSNGRARRATSRVSSSSRSTAWPTRSWPAGSGPARSTRWPAGSATRATRLSRWEAILPSMTSASQAGILHGNNDGIPAFRWYERDRQHLMVSSNPVDAAEIVRRVSNGEGLLSNNGASICNLMTGDATRVLPDDRRAQGRVAGHRRQQGVHGLLLQPDRLPPLVHAVPGRVRQGADPGPSNATIRHAAADAPRDEVRRHARREQRPSCATSTRR